MDNKGFKFIDMHCHYNELSIFELKKQFNSNEQISLTAAVSLESINRLEKIRAENIKGLYFAYGLYPDVILKCGLEECLEQLIKINFSNAIAIGEVGIDYKITKDREKRKEQQLVFEKQLELAEKLNYPIIIHTRYATKKILDILSTTSHKKIILHWYSGTEEEIKTALDRGYYLTSRFGRPIIPDIKEHLNQIFIETDYPISYEGKELVVSDIKKSYGVFSTEYKIELNELKEIIQTNFLKLFPNINI